MAEKRTDTVERRNVFGSASVQKRAQTQEEKETEEAQMQRYRDYCAHEACKWQAILESRIVRTVEDAGGTPGTLAVAPVLAYTVNKVPGPTYGKSVHLDKNMSIRDHVFHVTDTAEQIAEDVQFAIMDKYESWGMTSATVKMIMLTYTVRQCPSKLDKPFFSNLNGAEYGKPGDCGELHDGESICSKLDSMLGMWTLAAIVDYNTKDIGLRMP